MKKKLRKHERSRDRIQEEEEEATDLKIVGAKPVQNLAKEIPDLAEDEEQTITDVGG